MRRLIRNIEGEPEPLILHPRLHRLRVVDQHVRFAACKVLGLQYRVAAVHVCPAHARAGG